MLKLVAAISIVICVGVGVYFFWLKSGSKEKESVGIDTELIHGTELILEVRYADVIRLYVEDAYEYNTDLDFTNRMDRALYDISMVSDRDIAIDKFLSDCSNNDLYAIFGTASREKIKADLVQRVESSIYGVLRSLGCRIDALGVAQPNIQRIATNRISIWLPGIKESERVRKVLLSSALVEFWAVGTQNDINHVSGVLTSGQFDEVINAQLAKIRPGLVADKEDIESINEALNHPDVKNELRDYKLAWENKSIDGKNYGDFRLVVLKGKEPLMDGSGITDARAQSNDQNGVMGVSITMEGEAAKEWANVTANNVGKAIAIVMDGVVYSAPNVREHIIGGESHISGNFSVQEAEDLANVLNAPLPVPPLILSSR